MTTDTVSRFLDAVTSGQGIPTDLYAPTAVLDATVPHWRLSAEGPEAIAGQLSGWFADPGRFTEVSRIPSPTGEVVRFNLTWTEGGQQMAAHQVHVIDLTDDTITRQQVWCGGRWDASLQAEIAAAREGS